MFQVSIVISRFTQLRMYRMYFFLPLYIFSISWSVTTYAQAKLPKPSKDKALQLSQATQAILENLKGVGILVKIYRSNHWAWEYAGGSNSHKSAQPLHPNMIFRSASISKLFCATAILKLVESEKIALNDKIELFLPKGYTDHFINKNQITISDLLQHTSGLMEPQDMLGILEDPKRNFRDSLFSAIQDVNKTDFHGHFSYSNANYALLSLIIERISGKSYQQFLKEIIFEPLHLKDTYVNFLPLDRRMRGYIPGSYLQRDGVDADSLVDYSEMNTSWGPGGADISSTTSDLIKFLYNLENGKLVPMSLVRLMTSTISRPIFRQIFSGYGLGTMIFPLTGREYAVGHTGHAPGYTNLLCWIPSTDTYVCVAFNRHAIPVKNFIEYLNKIVDVLKQEKPNRSSDQEISQ